MLAFLLSVVYLPCFFLKADDQSYGIAMPKQVKSNFVLKDFYADKAVREYGFILLSPCPFVPNKNVATLTGNDINVKIKVIDCLKRRSQACFIILSSRIPLSLPRNL